MKIFAVMRKMTLIIPDDNRSACLQRHCLSDGILLVSCHGTISDQSYARLETAHRSAVG
jgi:hypothetical protein